MQEYAQLNYDHFGYAEEKKSSENPKMINQ